MEQKINARKETALTASATVPFHASSSDLSSCCRAASNRASSSSSRSASVQTKRMQSRLNTVQGAAEMTGLGRTFTLR